MATPWEDNIKNTRQLTVFPTALLSRSIWGPIFKAAIVEFNQLAVTKKLGVSLVETATPPDPDGDGGANIQCDIGNGTAKFKVLGEEKSVPFSGSGIHGMTQTVKRVFGKNPARMFKCFIFVPANPTIVPPSVKGPARPRVVGDGVKLFVFVHEFVHAAGSLENREHSTESDPDVFLGIPQASPTVDADVDPKKDKVRVGAFPNFTRLPPITLSARTVGLIQPNWK